MSLRVCPIATVNAPVQRVWSLLSNPDSYALWWDARTISILPTGSAQTGQKIKAQTTRFGKKWNVTITVEWVDELKHKIHLITKLPLGITVYNHIVCIPLHEAICQVSFG